MEGYSSCSNLLLYNVLDSNKEKLVLSVEKDKKAQCSRIHVWSDGAADGNNSFLINVPNGLFKQIHGEGVDK